MPTTLKTLPQIDAALRSRVRFHNARGKQFMPRFPPLLHPVQFEREYFRDLHKSFTKLYFLVESTLVRALPSLLSQGARELGVSDVQTFDAFDDELSAILSGILVEFGRELTQDEIKQLAISKGFSVSEFNKAQNKKVYKRVLDVDVFADDQFLSSALNNFATENARLITTLSEKHINEVRGIVTQAVRQGLTVGEVTNRLRERVGKTDANLKLIARDQISKLNGQLTMIRQTQLGITRYTWRTALDERVRATHKVHEGVVFSWDDPPKTTGHPGEDFQCRCYAEPVLEDLITDASSEI